MVTQASRKWLALIMPGTTKHIDGGWEVIIPLAPVPASRPRVSRWGTYYSKTYATWKAEAETLLGTSPEFETAGPVMVIVENVCKRPAKAANPYPNPDVDNFAKAALDAVTKSQLIWKDDKQITELYVSKRYARKDEEPHTRIVASHSHRSREDVYDLPEYLLEEFKD